MSTSRAWVWFAAFGGMVGGWLFRGAINDMLPSFERSGVVASTDSYEIEEYSGTLDQIRTRAIYEVVFEDGSWAEGHDIGLLELPVGQHATVSCRHDRLAIPVLQPSWWGCHEARVR